MTLKAFVIFILLFSAAVVEVEILTKLTVNKWPSFVVLSERQHIMIPHVGAGVMHCRSHCKFWHYVDYLFTLSLASFCFV